MWSAGGSDLSLSRQRSTINPHHRTFEAFTLSRFAGGRCASRGSIGHRKDGKLPAVHAHVFGAFSTRTWKLPFFFSRVRPGRSAERLL